MPASEQLPPAPGLEPGLADLTPPAPGVPPPPAWAPAWPPAWPPPQPVGGSERTGPLPLHPMTVSDILDGAFKLLKGNARTILIIGAIFVVPLQTLAAFAERNVGLGGMLSMLNDPASARAGAATSSSTVVTSGVILVLGLLLTPFIAGAVSRVVSASYVGAAEPPGAALRATFERSWALIASFVLVHLLELVGGALCFFPGLAVMTVFVAVAPAIVIEGLGPIAGMRRSVQLLRGRFWATLGVALLAAALTSFVSGVLATPFTLIGALLGHSGWVLVAVGGTLAGLVSRPIVAIVATLQYYDGRIRTEGYDLQVLLANLEAGARG